MINRHFLGDLHPSWEDFSSKRLERLLNLMRRDEIEALLITEPYNSYYMTGLTSTVWPQVTMLILLDSNKDHRLILDPFYGNKEVASMWHKVPWEKGNWIATVADEVKKLGITTLAFEQGHITFSIHQKLRKAMPQVQFQPTRGYVKDLRLVKDAYEIECLRKAAQITDQAFLNVAKQLRPGLQEREIANLLVQNMEQLGSMGCAFPPIVSSGERAAIPDAYPTGAVLRQGDMLTLDFGAIYQGYRTDIARTVVLGDPTEQQKEWHAAVCEAQKRTIQSICAGCSRTEVGTRAEGYLRAQGYKENLSYAIGHGIGLASYEQPYLDFAFHAEDLEEDSDTLQSGMVVAVEPGIYFPGLGGVCVEDDVWVKEEGNETLTQAPHDLRLKDIVG